MAATSVLHRLVSLHVGYSRGINAQEPTLVREQFPCHKARRTRDVLLEGLEPLPTTLWLSLAAVLYFTYLHKKQRLLHPEVAPPAG